MQTRFNLNQLEKFMNTTKYTEAEREEARYEMWVESGGRAKMADEHRELALKSVDEDIKPNGWKLLSYEVVTESGSDFAVAELVIRRGNDLELIRWKPFNKGWMVKLDHGWGIFNAK
jgi:hypothetical protein